MNTYRVHYRWAGKHPTSRTVRAENATLAWKQVTEAQHLTSVWKLAITNPRRVNKPIQVSR